MLRKVAVFAAKVRQFFEKGLKMSKVGKVTTSEALPIRVGKWLQSTSSFSVKDSSLQESEWLSLYQLERRWSSLFFETGYNAINLKFEQPSKNWVMHVIGREFLERAEALAKFMAETFNVDVHVKLTSEERCYPLGY